MSVCPSKAQMLLLAIGILLHLQISTDGSSAAFSVK